VNANEEEEEEEEEEEGKRNVDGRIESYMKLLICKENHMKDIERGKQLWRETSRRRRRGRRRERKDKGEQEKRGCADCRQILLSNKGKGTTIDRISMQIVTCHQ